MALRSAQLDDRLIEILADGQFHSGQALADKLGVSRTAINKRINALEELHLDIFRVHGKGYKLSTSLQLLNHHLLKDYLQHPQTPLYVKRVTSSTHDDLKQLLEQAPGNSLFAGTAIVAEMQTAGKGRRGKQWLSPFGTNLYSSFYWPLEDGLNSALGLSVAVGICLAELLEKQGIQGVSVKWPNDVYIGGKKVAGILVELEGQSTGDVHALIGIGLNLSMPERFGTAINQPFTDIQRHLDEPLDRHYWAGLLVNQVRNALSEFSRTGLAPSVVKWRRLDHFYGRPVCVLLGQHAQHGIAQGIDDHGALLVRQENGLKRYFGGEISIRSAV